MCKTPEKSFDQKCCRFFTIILYRDQVVTNIKQGIIARRQLSTRVKRQVCEHKSYRPQNGLQQ